MNECLNIFLFVSFFFFFGSALYFLDSLMLLCVNVTQ